jgi:hypothetical protein
VHVTDLHGDLRRRREDSAKPTRRTIGRMRPDWLTESLDAARWAVERWAGFPVDRVPRPLVVWHTAYSDGGFRSGEAKEAFLYGRVSAPAAVPEAVLAAIAEFSGPPPAGLEPLVITAAEESSAEFWTDRGKRRVPAWRLESEEANGPLCVLAAESWSPAPPTWRPPASRHMHFSAVMSADQRTLTVSFVGGPPAHADYPRAEVVESDRAVAVVPVEVDLLPPGTWRAPVGCERVVEARLARPLGAPVLVDLDSSPCEVTPA